MSRVRVAFLVDVLREHFDGVSNTMHQIISRIPRNRIEPIFITPQIPNEDIGFPVYQCPYYEFPFYKDYRFALPRRMKGLEMILDDFDPDIIHWSSPTKLGSYAVKYALKNQLPVTTIYHTHFPTYANYYLGFIPRVEQMTEKMAKRVYWLYRESDHVFAPTNGMCEYLIGKGVKEEKVSVWGRGVNVLKFSPGKKDVSYFADKRKKMLFVSRLVREKETDTLIRLYRLLDQERKDIQLVITGDGPDRKRMEKNMPGALFTGKLMNEELAKIYASSDVFIFPSVTETFGNVILEAMASGLPVVAAAAGGPKDIVENGKTGFLVEPKNERAFFSALTLLTDDSNLYQRMRSHALDYAVRQNWEHLCEELFTKYESLKTKD